MPRMIGRDRNDLASGMLQLCVARNGTDQQWPIHHLSEHETPVQSSLWHVSGVSPDAPLAKSPPNRSFLADCRQAARATEGARSPYWACAGVGKEAAWVMAGAPSAAMTAGVCACGSAAAVAGPSGPDGAPNPYAIRM